MGAWLWGILYRLEEKLEVEARNELEGSDMEKEKDEEVNEELEEEEEKRPQTEENGAEDVVRAVEDKEKGDGM
jgi:hypothetical protein